MTLVHAKKQDGSNVGVVIVMCDYYGIGSCGDMAVGFIPDDEEYNEGAPHFLCGTHADEISDSDFVWFTKLP